MIEAGSESTPPASASVAPSPTVAPLAFADVPFYTVVQGDTIGRIATKMGVDAQAVIDANGLTNPDKIRVGQKLRVPAGGKTAEGIVVGVAPAPEPSAGATTTRV